MDGKHSILLFLEEKLPRIDDAPASMSMGAGVYYMMYYMGAKLYCMI